MPKQPFEDELRVYSGTGARLHPSLTEKTPGTRDLRAANTAFLQNAPLTGREISELLKLYSRAADDAAIMGDHFHLFWQEMDRRHRALLTLEAARTN